MFGEALIQCNMIYQLTSAIEMRLRQEELNRVNSELEAKGRELSNIQTKLQDTEKILVCCNC